MDEGVGIGRGGVKSIDPPKTTGGKSSYQVPSHWSRTKVGGSKMIRYHCSLDRKPCRPDPLIRYMDDAREVLWEITSLWALGGVWSQVWNLKELTEWHTRSGSCGLIWPNTGKLTKSRHIEDWQIDSSFLIMWLVVHGRFLVGGVICLVNSVNERDLILLNINGTAKTLIVLLKEVGNYFPLVKC